MNCWIVLYTHRHGTDTWPMFQSKAPSKSEMIASVCNWEEDEHIECVGPFEVPHFKELLNKSTAWWRQLRPCDWSQKKHLDNPAINTNSPQEKSLAMCIAKIKRSK